MIVAGILGVYDDLQNLVGKVAGHEPWFWAVKWGVHIGIAVVTAVLLYTKLDIDAVLVPHFGAYSLGILYIPVVIIVFVGATSGAVITDGMDGLMAGVSAFAYVAYGVIALGAGAGRSRRLRPEHRRRDRGISLLQRQPGSGLYGRSRLAGACRRRSSSSPS